MTNTTTLFKNKQPIPNIRFWDENKLGNNIIYLPEVINGKVDEKLPTFLSSQIKAYYQNITIPPIITNFLGRKLSSQKHYLYMKKELPIYQYGRTPKSSGEKTSIFDMSGMVSDLTALSKSRSQKLLFTEFMKLVESITKDYETGDSILFIDGDDNISFENSDLLNIFIYNARLLSNSLKTSLKGIVYKLDKMYYPIAVPSDKEGVLTFVKSNIGKISQFKSKHVDTAESLENIKSNVETILSSDSSSKLKDVKSELNKHPELYGTIDNRLNTLFGDDVITDTVKHLNTEVNKKYNGNVTVNIKKTGVFDSQKIVGLDELGNYNKQSTELSENIDELIEDLIHSTLESDPDVDIKILGIKTKIVDDNKNRYKEFRIRIQHKDFGKTTNKPYTITFRVPVPVNGKYVKIGGNNFVMINQLFPKVLQKVGPNLVRLYTHFSTASLKLKNTKLEKNDYDEVEEGFLQRIKSLKKKVDTTNMTNDVKDDISEKYGITDLTGFKYSKITIKI